MAKFFGKNTIWDRPKPTFVERVVDPIAAHGRRASVMREGMTDDSGIDAEIKSLSDAVSMMSGVKEITDLEKKSNIVSGDHIGATIVVAAPAAFIILLIIDALCEFIFDFVWDEEAIKVMSYLPLGLLIIGALIFAAMVMKTVIKNQKCKKIQQEGKFWQVPVKVYVHDSFNKNYGKVMDESGKHLDHWLDISRCERLRAWDHKRAKRTETKDVIETGILSIVEYDGVFTAAVRSKPYFG